MDRKIVDEEGVFKLTNYQSHPTNSSYIVFHYSTLDMANDFEIKLAAAGIPFERNNPEDGEQEKYYFGIRRMHFKKAKKINYLVYGHHRAPFIGNKIYKWIILGFTIAIIGLAIVGAIVSNFN